MNYNIQLITDTTYGTHDLLPIIYNTQYITHTNYNTQNL